MPIEQFGALAPDAAAESEEDDLLAAAVAALDPRDRRLIRLYHYQELTVRHIGQILGCDASTVSRHLHRIHEALRSKLETTDGVMQRNG
jgi:RNA polymerase sigma factor (sigma-70 family)